jgi:hypothetical protein
LGLAYRDTTHQLISNTREMEESYPNEASCQLMKHSIAVFQLRLDGGDRYVAPIIANRWRAVYQLPIYLIG